jgi:hypothetical protein
MNDSLATRLVGLVVSPGPTMARVGADPRWWQAGLLIFVVTVAITWLILPIVGPEQLELMRDSRLMRMMPEDVWQEQYEKALDPSPLQRSLSALQGGFQIWVTVIVFGFVLGFFARMGGGHGSFKQALGVVSWGALIPFVLGALVKTPLVIVTEAAYRVNIGLAALVPGLEPTSPLFMVLLHYGDFFTWWGLIVLVLGFERVFAMGRAAAAMAVLLPWALLQGALLGVQMMIM